MQTTINKIDIKISKAFIKGISVAFHDDDTLPRITTTVALLTETGKQITEVSFSTQDYYGTKIDPNDIPVSIHNKIATIVSDIAPIIQRKINAISLMLEG